MRGRSSVVCVLLLIGAMLVGALVDVAWTLESAEEQIQGYLDKYDLGLSREEEMTLKREFVASGALDRLRLGRKKALTEEENRIYAYLTRPVRARDEANPEGQRPIISGYCDGILPFETVERLFLARGLRVLRKRHNVSDTSFELEAQPGIDVVYERQQLEEEGVRLAEGMGLKNVYPIKASPSPFLQDGLIPNEKPGIHIAKNRAYCTFIRPVTAKELQSLTDSAGLIVLAPRVDFESADDSWTTDRATFFIADSTTVGAVIDRLFDCPEVRYANPDGWMTLSSYIPERNDPNDEKYNATPSESQWYFLQNRNANGSNSNGDDSRDFDVDAPEGWDIQTGSAGTVIAVIDAGFKMNHTDLASRWWVNTDEQTGESGVDDDGNGYVDDVNGFDFADSSGTIDGAHYHGTMVAGMAGAATNNTDIMAGGTWGCSIMALRIDATATVEVRNEQTRLAIEYARSMGANVINMSLVMALYDDDFRLAILAAWNSGIVITAGGGNQHNDPNDPRLYPADYDNVLEVAGTADDNTRFYLDAGHGSGWGQGEFGPDLCAPAEDILALCNGSSGGPCYGALWVDEISGTSLAAPIVAGLAALVMDQHSLHGQSADVVRILKGAVDDVDGEVVNETGSSSIPHPGPDDLGTGRVNFFKALAPPRIRIVTLLQDDIAIFKEGDLNGNSVFNWIDEDMDGDSYANSDDNNDDGDSEMDGDDTDDDGDGVHDSSDSDVCMLSTDIEAGRLDVKILFNESMLLDGVGGVDPTVKLILTDGSELQFQPAASGNADWDTLWVANDQWFGKIDALTEEDISKMYGDLRLTISGTVDLAGDTLDWDLDTSGAQAYEYPLHVPGFVASESDENAGVERNTTSVGESTWPMGWGKLDVMGRGFNTDASDPLSVQSMTVDIERLFADTILVSDAAMMLSERDFFYEWDAASNPEFIDCEYEVTLKAFDGTSEQILTDMERNIVLDKTVPIIRKILGTLGRPGGRERIQFYSGEWVDGELEVEIQKAMPLQADTMFFDIWYNEPVMPGSTKVKLVGSEPEPEFWLSEVAYDSTDYHWTGRVASTAWESIRNMLKGERTVSGYGRDRQGNLLDADPGSEAYRDSTGEWHDYDPESQGGPGLGRDEDYWDTNNIVNIAPFRDVCLAVDASSSQNLDGWELSQMHVFQHLIQWMMGQEDSDDYRVAAWRFCNIVEQIVDYDDSLDDAWAGLFDAGPQIVGVHEPGQFNPVNPFAGYMANTDVENPLLVAAQYATAEYDDPRVVCVVSDFWHNFGNTDQIVEARYHWIAEQGPIFLLANEGALYGSECSEELKEAARISGGGYLEGYGAASVESLYKAITPVFVSRGVLAQVDGAGSDTVSVRVDSTMTRLDVIVSLSSWSGAAISREREEGKERSRGTYQLRDQGGSLVAPTYYGSGLCQWEVESPGTGIWCLEVSAAPTEEYSVMARGSTPIELRLLSTGSIAEGATDTIEIKIEWERLDNEVFELIDQNGSTEAILTLSEESIRVYSGLYTFDEAGHYRVRIRGDLGTQVVERETELCLNVRAAPTIELISPASGETETAGTSYTIEWIDSCPERNASVTIGYDDDEVYSGTEEIIAVVEEAGADTGRAVWEIFTVPEGVWHIWACIDDSLNSPVRGYGGTVTVTKGYQEGWPVNIYHSSAVRTPILVADIDGVADTYEVILGADSLYAFRFDGTICPGFPMYLHGRMPGEGVAAGDVDGDGSDELVIATADTGLVWVIGGTGVVENSWTKGSPSWVAPLLIDLTGDGIKDIVVGGTDDQLRAWEGDGTPLGGNWPVTLSGSVQASPVGGDLIGSDGSNEVIAFSRLGTWGGKLFVISADGSIAWSQEIPSCVFGSPAVCEMDGDPSPEIVYASWSNTGGAADLFVVNGEDGTAASGWTGGKDIGTLVESSPAIGYLTLSGSPSILIANRTGDLLAWSNTGEELWNKQLSGYPTTTSSPLIADLDGDMNTEAILATSHRVYVLNAAEGDTITGFCRSTGSSMLSTAAIHDLDNDGDLELIAVEADGIVHCWDLPGSTWTDGQGWVQFKSDRFRSGRYSEGADPSDPELISAEFVAPDSMRVTWRTVDEDVYGRDELVRKYVVYRDDEPYGVDGSTMAGEVDAPDTSFTEQSAAVGDPNQSVFYRVKAEDPYENRSVLSDSTMGEVDFGLGEALKERADRRKAAER